MFQRAAGNDGEAKFHPNRELLHPGLKAPLPVAPNARGALSTAFRLLIERAGVDPELKVPAAVTGGGLIHACQEFVLACNAFADGRTDCWLEAVRALLWAARDFSGALNGSYVLEQAAQTVEGGQGKEAPADLEKMKDLMGPMERCFDRLKLPRMMSAERFAVVQVHLDEVYDIASRQIERFYRELSFVEEPSAAPRGNPAVFLRGLHQALARAIVPDHIIAKDSRAGRENSGLQDLLPELEREFLGMFPEAAR